MIRQSIIHLQLIEDITLYRRAWRSRIRVERQKLVRSLMISLFLGGEHGSSWSTFWSLFFLSILLIFVLVLSLVILLILLFDLDTFLFLSILIIASSLLYFSNQFFLKCFSSAEDLSETTSLHTSWVKIYVHSILFILHLWDLTGHAVEWNIWLCG